MKILVINNFFNAGGSFTCAYNGSLNSFVNQTSFMGLAGDTYPSVCDKLVIINDDYLKYSLDYNNLSKDKITIAQTYPNKHIKHELSSFADIVNYLEPDIIHLYIPGEQKLEYFNQIKNYKCKKFCTVLCGQRIGFDPNIFDDIVFISKYNMNLNKDLLPKGKGKVIYPGIHVSRRYRKVRNHSDFIAGRISAYCPSKLIHHSMECAKILKHINFSTSGIGADPKYEEYINKSAPQNFSVNKEVSNWQKISLLGSKYKLYHYPTSNEAFCISIAEAMGYGLPVISYNNSAIPEFIEGEEKHGLFLVDSFNDLVYKTEELYELYKKDFVAYSNLGKLNRLIIQGKYSTYNYREKLNKLYG